MDTSRNVKFSIQADKSLEKILNYLFREHSKKLQTDFLDKLYFSLNAIKLNPESFPKSEINKKQYRCVVSWQTTLYYRFNSKEIRVLALFDTRMNPEKIKKIK
ncbi:type II toxin-antitoxin system RelE/ParE family toxin [Flavobacterium azooxidireducens]|uniref:Type II toxin-antitoxin system RelE/ParE family toxin n=1 Tax=Flavobacterium azooxidireducens TaxID=1871076 RepID=A0ABY4KAA6_9FLAO|nr:type II toxin-antitoxin system RelE/ParE family toxin [Flavobacterium azooxidireducens]UPQ77727.1 type II toxin-antitoxin system RelE/ParE family toxin [Flavobacterium azooxidireducens]